MPDIETQLLQHIADEVNRVRELSPIRELNADPLEWANRHLAITLWKESEAVAVSPEWIGRSDAERKARQRAIKRLAERGWITIVSAGRRYLVALTNAGELVSRLDRLMQRMETALESVGNIHDRTDTELTAFMSECEYLDREFNELMAEIECGG